MRAGLAVVALLLTSCVLGGAAPQSHANATLAAASVDAMTPYFGSYAMDDGDVVVIARMGWFFDLRDAAYRTIYGGGSTGRFTIGWAFLEPVPKYADLAFVGTELSVRTADKTRAGHRIAYRTTDVSVPSRDAVLAATITEPLTQGPHPGIVVVHGAEPGQRHFYDVWVGIYASLGLDVLTYDKRGIGKSTGTYPGESPTPDALAIYAGDADAARSFLDRWPGVDAQRVGFHGGSQGGWTVPLTMLNHRGAAGFAVLVSAPATDVDQTDLWAGFSGNGAALPSEPVDQMLAAVRAARGGYDPAPALHALAVPVLWVLGTNDRTVPTTVCLEILRALDKPNITVQMLPTGHGLLVNATGLDADDAKSPGLAPQLLPALRSWLGKVLAF